MNSQLSAVIFTIELFFLVTNGEEERLMCPRVNSQWPSNRVNTTLRLVWLRNEMSRVASQRRPIYDAFIVTSEDDHQGEFVADRDKRRQYISGFSGSFGNAVVTRSKAALWTDGRYYLQADQELDCNWLLINEEKEEPLSITEWLKKELRAGSRVGADPKLIPSQIWDMWLKDLASSRIGLIEVPINLIDTIWTIGRPEYDRYPAVPHHLEFAGETWQSKVDMLRQNLTKLDCDAMVVTALDEIAWLLNIRGRDTPYSPFVRAYLIVMKDFIHLYIPKEKLSDSVKRHLRTDQYGPHGVRTHPYDTVWQDLATFAQTSRQILLPSPSVYSPGVSQAILSAVPPEKRYSRTSPIINMKARKNRAEAEGMRRAHVRDAAALTDFFAFIEDQIKQGQVWTEISAARKLDQFRSEQNYSQGPSFPTIIGFGSNGALPHHIPSVATDKIISSMSTVVIDSGGQYLDGTTDVTRTLHFGNPTNFQKKTYTKVLKGLIQLSSLTFPSNLKTNEVDVLARSPLWKSGMNYQHGTGHGVGAYLSVHESPINIGYDSRQNRQSFKEGYFFTNEPGYYKENEFGIRLENVLEVISRQPETSDEDDTKYLGFRDVTLVPFEPKLIDFQSLTSSEIDWLNKYNTRVRQEVGSELKRQIRMKAFHWLWEKTKHVTNDSSRSNLSYICIFLCLFSAFY